jgi:hypothetical protein
MFAIARKSAHGISMNRWYRGGAWYQESAIHRLFAQIEDKVLEGHAFVVQGHDQVT